uniref:Baculoviral IAP repeat-containing protein 5 n=1 Tax=Cacopsylla melanoneura TaxID=428564 RepID=A0A8D9E2F6_9HEMI
MKDKVSTVNFKDYIAKEQKLASRLQQYGIAVADPMVFFFKRLATFTNWPFKHGSCTGEHMAYAGYYCVQDDCAKCIYCVKELDGWEETDDPWEEHKSHKADCPFISLNIRDVTAMDISDFVMLNHIVLKNKRMDQFRKSRERLVQILEDKRQEIQMKLKK